jgi:hypothetical protein
MWVWSGRSSTRPLNFTVMLPRGGITLSMAFSTSAISARVIRIIPVNRVPRSRLERVSLRVFWLNMTVPLVVEISAFSQSTSTSFSPRFHSPR